MEIFALPVQVSLGPRLRSPLKKIVNSPCILVFYNQSANKVGRCWRRLNLPLGTCSVLTVFEVFPKTCPFS